MSEDPRFKDPLYVSGHLDGIVDEQERIIKLLEIFANGECDEYCSYRCECYGKYEAQKFIALIKGETE